MARRFQNVNFGTAAGSIKKAAGKRRPFLFGYLFGLAIILKACQAGLERF
jgi:hypothetical protein